MERRIFSHRLNRSAFHSSCSRAANQCCGAALSNVRLSTGIILFPVFTNGTMLSESMLRLLDEHRNLVPIVSVEGNPDRRPNARRSAKAPTINSRKTWSRCATRESSLAPSVTLTTENFSVVTGDAFLQSTPRASARRLSFFVDYVPADPGTESLAPGDAEREALAGSAWSSSAAKQDGMIYVSFPGDEQSPDGCLAAGRGFFHINPSGGAEPCPFSPVSDTSLRQVSLIEALDSPLFVRLRASEPAQGAAHRRLRAVWHGTKSYAVLCGTTRLKLKRLTS